MDYPYAPILDLRDRDVMRERAFACSVARSRGNFWLPCPLCGTPFGGHEWLWDQDGGSVVTEDCGPGESKGICPFCTMAGRGLNWAKDHPLTYIHASPTVSMSEKTTWAAVPNDGSYVGVKPPRLSIVRKLFKWLAQ